MQIRHIVIVVFVRFVQKHRKIARIKPRFGHPRYPHVESLYGQAPQNSLEFFLVRPKIEKGSYHHVSAYARIALQIQRLHRSHSFVSLSEFLPSTRPLQHNVNPLAPTDRNDLH